MEKVSKKQKISLRILPTIKALGLYEPAFFSMRRVSTISASIQRVQTETDKRFSYSTDKDDEVITVIRTK